MAAFIAFDMIQDEDEVDVYQIAQDIRKANAQLEFSMASLLFFTNDLNRIIWN